MPRFQIKFDCGDIPANRAIKLARQFLLDVARQVLESQLLVAAQGFENCGLNDVAFGLIDIDALSGNVWSAVVVLWHS